MWRKPSGQITSASNVGKGDKSDSDALEVGDDYKQIEKKVSLEIPEREKKENQLPMTIEACHVKREEVKVIKTWRSWLKDPNLYKVQKEKQCYISVFWLV